MSQFHKCEFSIPTFAFNNTRSTPLRIDSPEVLPLEIGRYQHIPAGVRIGDDAVFVTGGWDLISSQTPRLFRAARI